MKIALFSSEAIPFAKVGGLADVIPALDRALQDTGCEVKVFVPKHRNIDTNISTYKRAEFHFIENDTFFTVMMFIGEGAGFKIQELSPLELITAVEGALSTFRSEKHRGKS